MNYFVESLAVDRDGGLVAHDYSDGRERKHLHTNARAAARDFGERVAMLNAGNGGELEFSQNGVEFRAVTENGSTISITLY